MLPTASVTNAREPRSLIIGLLELKHAGTLWLVKTSIETLHFKVDIVYMSLTKTVAGLSRDVSMVSQNITYSKKQKGCYNYCVTLAHM